MWLAFQPKVDLITRQTVGAEALARWTHPEKGPISPTEFVTAAEQSDRIEQLTDFVLDQAIESAADINPRRPSTSRSRSICRRACSATAACPAGSRPSSTRHGLAADRLTWS